MKDRPLVFVCLPLLGGGHVVFEIGDLDVISDNGREDDYAYLLLHSSQFTYRLAISAEEAFRRLPGAVYER